MLLFNLWLPITVIAQEQQTYSAESSSSLSDPQDIPPPDDPNDVPFDGGLLFLLAAGAAYCLVNHRRQKAYVSKV